MHLQIANTELDWKYWYWLKLIVLLLHILRIKSQQIFKQEQRVATSIPLRIWLKLIKLLRISFAINHN